ncbi:fumarylacetoacetate hydrolase family protein [Jiangella muralis]|uniref:fumarylacetoacetate hydrolase family protein n=1 Tax=Jiangella muralis TaxID=702383 RepID=UPI0009FB7BBD|nr:fumarylacetoacetate hydrolase family protein [Jiangella muralis]
MFLCRIRTDAGVVPAVRIDDETLLDLTPVARAAGDDLVALAATPGLAAAVASLAEDDAAVRIPVASARFEVPVARPQKIVCVALNYVAHAEEGAQAVPAEPVIFFKPPSSLLPHGETVRCPERSSRLDFEVELAVVIGTRARDVAVADWRDVVAGYTVLNDMTARDLQLVAIEKNQPWDHSKGFDTFAPCGPYLVTADEIADPGSLDLSLTTDGVLRQSSNTRHMVFGVPELISVISAGITLEPGDIIATGTPSGIGRVDDGGTMVATVEGVGSLVNPVAYDRAAVAAPA